MFHFLHKILLYQSETQKLAEIWSEHNSKSNFHLAASLQGLKLNVKLLNFSVLNLDYCPKLQRSLTVQLPIGVMICNTILSWVVCGNRTYDLWI